MAMMRLRRLQEFKRIPLAAWLLRACTVTELATQLPTLSGRSKPECERWGAKSQARTIRQSLWNKNIDLHFLLPETSICAPTSILFLCRAAVTSQSIRLTPKHH